MYRGISLLFALSCLVLFSCIKPQSNTAEKYPRASFLFMSRMTVALDCSTNKCELLTEAARGSGFAIAHYDGGTVGMTAGHVCDGAMNSEAISYDVKRLHKLSITTDQGLKSKADILGIYHDQDLCVFYVPEVTVPYIPLASYPPTYAEDAHTISAPLSIYEPGAVPILTGKYFGIFNNHNFDMYSIPSIFGSSGAPILNKRGELLGVISRAYPAFHQICISPRFYQVAYLVSSLRSGFVPEDLSHAKDFANKYYGGYAKRFTLESP